MLWGVDTSKVACILHDIEDDVVTITVERRGPTIFGMPVEEALKVILTVKCIFEEEGADWTAITFRGEPLDTESDDRETDQVVVSA